jgi:hypothetical protein
MRARFMSQDPQRWISYKALSEMAGSDAAARDRDGLLPERDRDRLFPERVFEVTEVAVGAKGPQRQA